MLFQNEKDPYVDAMIADIGYPLWERAIVIGNDEGSDEKGVLIPYVKLNNDFISAYVLAVILPDLEKNRISYCG